MTRHTPGPWHVSKHQDGRSMLVYGADDYEVARVCFPNRKENARLIAAAPDLLRVLVKLEQACADEGVQGMDILLAAARAAIAKATEESK